MTKLKTGDYVSVRRKNKEIICRVVYIDTTGNKNDCPILTFMLTENDGHNDTSLKIANDFLKKYGYKKEKRFWWVEKDENGEWAKSESGGFLIRKLTNKEACVHAL